MKHKKTIIIIAGANGAGKTSFAREFLRQEADIVEFVNADLIAAGLSPFNPEKVPIHAGKIMLNQIKLHVAKNNSFAFETTLSGLSYARMISEWKKAGYYVKLIYLKIANEKMAVARVKARVSMGGHNIPLDVIHRRFLSSWINFNQTYKVLVDSWVLYENSGGKPILLDKGVN